MPHVDRDQQWTVHTGLECVDLHWTRAHSSCPSGWVSTRYRPTASSASALDRFTRFSRLSITRTVGRDDAAWCRPNDPHCQADTRRARPRRSRPAGNSHRSTRAAGEWLFDSSAPYHRMPWSADVILGESWGDEQGRQQRGGEGEASHRPAHLSRWVGSGIPDWSTSCCHGPRCNGRA